MAKEHKINHKQDHHINILLIPSLLVFITLGGIFFTVTKQISREMSDAAIDNLSENLELIKGTVEAILKNEFDFQTGLAGRLAQSDNPEEFVRTYQATNSITKISLIFDGKTNGVSNIEDNFSADSLDFNDTNDTDEMSISNTYINYMGAWAYTIKTPVVKDDRHMATLYVEYMYETFDDLLPYSLYNGEASLSLMDTYTQRLVLTPNRINGVETRHLNLQDFYDANGISEDTVQSEIANNLNAGNEILFYHNIQNTQSLVFMWPVQDGLLYLVGYVGVDAIQQEGKTINQNILFVALSMLLALLFCCVVQYFYVRQQNKNRALRESEQATHNKQLADALQAAQIANTSKTAFLSNMSHDIRTPMNAVLGFTTLLKKHADNPDKTREYADKITSSGQHLLSLINDILDISKIESGKFALSIQPFNIEELVASVETIIRPTTVAKQQKFRITIQNLRHKTLLGDETRIRQILINLLSNAVKYTPSQGHISLHITGFDQRVTQYDHIRFEVEDDGIGMTLQYQSIIFDTFTREENRTTNKIQGTGLGMPITKNIVNLMGGTIEVSSELNKGSRFTVDLDLRIPETETTTPTKTPVSLDSSTLVKRHFLVAEDNDINAEILCELLDIEGASCEVVTNGQLAVTRFQEAAIGSFDAILMDVQMPVMNGYDATRAIRALPRPDAQTIPIIAMTANAFSDDVKNAMDAGMTAHVSKPIDMEILVQTIHTYIQRKD